MVLLKHIYSYLIRLFTLSIHIKQFRIRFSFKVMFFFSIGGLYTAQSDVMMEADVFMLVHFIISLFITDIKSQSFRILLNVEFILSIGTRRHCAN